MLYAPLALAESASFVPFVVTDAQTTRAFQEAGEIGSLRTPEEFAVAPVEGVIQVGRAQDSEVRSMRLFAKAHPTTFVLTAEVDDSSTAMFDGVVLGDEGQPIGNFSLKTLTSEDIEDLGDRVLRRMERYSAPAHWSFALRKAILLRLDPRPDPLPDGSIANQWPPEITIATPKRKAVYERVFKAYRDMTRFFGIGSGRPNWALLDLTALPPISTERISELSLKWTFGKPGRLVLILNNDRIYTLHAGRMLSRSVSCAARL